MKNGIPCNETRFTNGKDRNRIVYQFVADDGVTPSTCTIRIGDKDPLTGEPITDMDFFLREYYRLEDSQVHRNIENSRMPYSKEQKAWREKEKQKFIRDFEQDHGYRPSADDILYHLEQIEPERYNQNLGGIMNNEGEPVDEFGNEFIRYDTDPFGADLPDDICALQEIADSLTGRLRAVYEAMLQRAADGAGRMTLTDVQREWNVSYTQIMKDTKKIEKMIREKIQPKYQK